MDVPTDEKLHALARSVAERLTDPDRKQLRFNDIVTTAKLFYPTNPVAGVVELVQACDRECTDLYVKGAPMHETLNKRYSWMLS